MTLLTGGGGQLGTQLQKMGKFYAPHSWEFNVTHPDEHWLLSHCPQIDSIVHAAADTHVVKIEEDPIYTSNAIMVNVMGTLRMALLANSLSVPFYHISTETCINPYNTYAKTKLLAEDMAKRAKQYVILRTSFRNVPFEYEKAFVDQWTIGDSVEVIAEILIERFRQPTTQLIEYVGTGVKTTYELAQKTRPDVIPIGVDEMNKYLRFKVEKMEELKNI